MEYKGFVGPSCPSSSNVADVERTINLYPELIEGPGGKSKAVLLGTPGLALWGTLGPAGPVWAMVSMAPSSTWFYVLAGTQNAPHLYAVQNLGGAIPASTSVTDLGAPPGMGTANNVPWMISNGSQLLIGGAVAAKGAVFTPTSAGNAGSWTAIDAVANSTTQGGWPANCTSATLIDGYFIVSTFTGGNFAISQPNDGTQWPPLEFAAEEDGPESIIALANLRRELWLFGAQRTEVYYDSGNALFPFERIPGAVINVGCNAPQTVVPIAGTIFFVGSENPITGPGMASMSVYMTEGYNAKRISTHGIEHILETWMGAVGVNSLALRAWAYQDAGHTFYLISVPNAGCVCYDMTTGLWHERTSTITYPTQAGVGLPGTCCLTYNGAILIGGVFTIGGTGVIYQMSRSFLTDAGSDIVRTRVGPHIAAENKINTFPLFTLDCDGTSAPTLSLSWSNDGGQSWSTGISATAATNNAGTRVVWRRLGKSRDRVFRVDSSSAMQHCWIDAYIEMSPGDA